jgi:hypothetical protein
MTFLSEDVDAVAGVGGVSRTALVFSVFRFPNSLSAIACTAVFSFLPSDALSGACMLRSIS